MTKKIISTRRLKTSLPIYEFQIILFQIVVSRTDFLIVFPNFAQYFKTVEIYMQIININNINVYFGLNLK